MVFKYGVAARPIRGEVVSGDSYYIAVDDGRPNLVAVIDGTGHGVKAHEGAVIARKIIEDGSREGLAPEEIVKECHSALRGTRGASLGVLRFQEDGAGEFCGVGNIEVVSVSKKNISVICLPGIAGQNVRKFKTFDFSWTTGDTLCIFSDGVSRKFSLEQYLKLDVETIAEKLLEDYGREHDDATIVALRCE